MLSSKEYGIKANYTKRDKLQCKSYVNKIGEVDCMFIYIYTLNKVLSK